MTSHNEAERRRHTAYHEAAHATVAWLLGSLVETVTIIPGRDETHEYGGRVEYSPGRTIRPEHAADTSLCILFAGAVADRITDPSGGRDYACKHDLELADALLATGKATLSPGTLWAATERLVREEWPRIERLALVLLTCGELDWENAVSVLEGGSG